MTGFRDLTRNHDFTVLWIGTTTSQLGSAVSQIAFPLAAYALSGSAVVTSVVAALEMTGNLVTLLPAGAWADRFDRRRLMRLSALGGGLVYATVVAAQLAGVLTLPHLYLAAFLTGAAAGLFAPAETSAVRTVVAPEELPTALAQNQSRQWIASLLGSPLGGALYGLIRWLPFAADAASYAVNWMLLGRLRADLSPGQRALDAPRPRLLAEVVGGWRFLYGHPFFRVLCTWSPLANLTINAVFYVALLRLVAAGFPGWQIGLEEAIVGLLGILGALAAPRVIERLPTGWLTILAAWSFVPLLFLIAQWNNPWVVAAATGAGIFVNPIGNAGIGAYTQRLMPTDMIGRFSSTMSFTSLSTHPLAPLLAGGALALLGGRAAVYTTMAMCALVALIPTSSRAIRSVPRPAIWQAELIPRESAQASASSLRTG
jgi:MFS family permease